ncbi:MAG TPA: pyridoxamine 5'-phosphate oxidase family protein [Acidocella sp.]|jgi:nitroimidazol reductase NimA-like FMN-containing flavoprotein (pyridoxamine 5'-phosphate oxidase superfamily)|nr:pyridoxamine 5'-phosphate oxidase family protein [Acidocella sp.]
MSTPPSERARVKRYNHIASYDRDTVHAILDAMPLCHVGYVFKGSPYVTPTLQWRDGDRIFWHGSSASRMLESAEAHDVCVTVSLYDGLVMARSAYNYNINHRSVMIFGKPEKLANEEKEAQLRNFVNKTIPGQWERLRPVLPKELKATTVLTMPITEASAKLRDGHTDDDDDADFPVWTGIIPVRYEIGAPIANPKNLPGVEMPEEALQFKIG